MFGKFAHISDCHIGAWRDPRLRELNDGSFAKAVDSCIENQVDFVIISGDIFDVGIPEMASVRSAVRKLRELDRHGIPAYVVYGSHDYSPTTVSFVEVLTSAGLFTNVGEFAEEKESLLLKSVIDEKTGVIISGLPARRGGLESKLYQKLDTSNIPKNNEHYSIFVFHASINELQSLNITIEQSLSISDLPKGFSYYAGGHIHKRSEGKIDSAPVVYPGPLFGTSYTDLELTAKGEHRGFALVEFDGNKTSKVNYVDLPMPRIYSKVINADGKSAQDVSKELSEYASRDEVDFSDAIFLLKVKGALSSGRPYDIDWFKFRREIQSRGALVVNVNHASLSSQEMRKLARLGTTNREEIESKILSQRMDSNPHPSNLNSSKAKTLLKALKSEKRDEETKQTFEKRIIDEASRILDFETGESS